MLNMITDMTAWGLIFFFIFEIKAVADLILSTSHTQYKA